MRDKSAFNYQFFKLDFIKHQLVNILLILLVLLIMFSADSVLAAPIAERLKQFPQWQNKPPVELAKGDLKYPEWMAGTWNVKSTLVEKIAPLAPEIVTPGFEDNDNYLNQAIAFQVRFGTEYYSPPHGVVLKV